MENDTRPKLQAWAYGKGDGTYYGVVELRGPESGKLLGKRISKKIRLSSKEALQDAIALKRTL